MKCAPSHCPLVHYGLCSPIFGPFFDPTRPLAALPAVRPRHNYTVHGPLPADELLAALREPAAAGEPPSSSTVHHYLNVELARVADGALEADLAPLDELIALNPRQVFLSFSAHSSGSRTATRCNPARHLREADRQWC